jgi:hypothetical protein
MDLATNLGTHRSMSELIKNKSQHGSTFCILLLWLTYIMSLDSLDALIVDSQSNWSTPKSIGTVTTMDDSVNFFTRRKVFHSILSTVSLIEGTLQTRSKVWADTMDTPSLDITTIEYENRDRKGNQNAVIRDDYWYITGKLPPRLLTTQLKGDDPQWNAFGSCTTSESTGTNSCTYVSINQRRSAYTKYASSISYGAKEYQKIGTMLQSIQDSKSSYSTRQQLWYDIATLVNPYETIPPATVDSELKMVLLATALLTSPNFPGPSRELLVSRFYANEVRFAHRTLYNIATTNLQQEQQQEQESQEYEPSIIQAQQAYSFGRDSWNSYFQSISRSIVPKVGDPFVPIV